MLRRERLSSALKNQQYIPQLLDVFQKAEDIEDEPALKSLYEIFKAIWMLNQGEIYEILFNQKYIFDVVGVMEYDPSRKTNPVKHREFLRNKASFRDVLPITDNNLRDKINQTYRMQVMLLFDILSFRSFTLVCARVSSSSSINV
jgi:protein phosphatase-4 regulatory subunit 3